MLWNYGEMPSTILLGSQNPAGCVSMTVLKNFKLDFCFVLYSVTHPQIDCISTQSSDLAGSAYNWLAQIISDCLLRTNHSPTPACPSAATLTPVASWEPVWNWFGMVAPLQWRLWTQLSRKNYLRLRGEIFWYLYFFYYDITSVSLIFLRLPPPIVDTLSKINMLSGKEIQ